MSTPTKTPDTRVEGIDYVQGRPGESYESYKRRVLAAARPAPPEVMAIIREALPPVRRPASPAA